MYDVRRYRLRPDGLEAAQQRVRARFLVPQMLVVVAVIVLSLFLITRHNPNRTTLLGAVFFGGFFITYIAFVGTRRMRSSIEQTWNSYQLEIGPDYLQRSQSTTPELRLAFSEITRIERIPGRYLRVIGSSRQRAIAIPESIEHFPDILAILSALRPIAESRSDRSLKSFVLTVLGFAGYLTMLWSNSPRIVLPLALLVTAFLVWLIIFLQRNPNATYTTKRQSWFYLVIVFTCVIKVLVILRLLRF